MIIPALLLVSLGIAVIYSSDTALAIQQAVYALIGVIIYLFLSNFDYRALKVLVKPYYILILVLLLIIFIIGVETQGSLRWISIGPFNFQPSEFAKIALILSLAQFWELRIANLKNILISVLILLPLFALIFKQPDLGTALTIGFMWFVILIAANTSVIKLFIMGLIGFISAPIVWLFLQDYQKQRIFSFLSPTQDPLSVGYNAIQAMVAVGSGEILGRGLGRGTQSRLQFLPEFRTDFIFAFIAEELGFLGSIMVLGLYLLIFVLGIRVLLKAEDRFGEIIVVGSLGMLFFQILVNIGMNTGILPITGITLPLLSYGGSSIITTFLSLGLIASVNRFSKKQARIDSYLI